MATATDPRLAEIGRQSRANLAAKFKLLDQINAIARQLGEPDAGLVVEMIERGLSLDEAHRELAQRAAVRSWSAALAGPAN